MSLEALNTFGTLLTVAIVAATAIAALVQLRHLRAGNQINAMLAIGEELSSKNFVDATRLVRQKFEATLDDPLFRDHIIASARNQSQPDLKSDYADMQRATVMVANGYEQLGILVKRGVVDKDMLLDAYAWVILANWKKMEPGLALSREVTGSNAIWENFEYLAVISEDWVKEHAGGTYPRGIRRMRLTNPWPVPPMPAVAH
jgi:Domain of unknown function (DUF4760)